MSIEQMIPWGLTLFFGAWTLYFSLKNSKRTDKNDIKDESIQLANVMFKLESIGDDIKEIKSDNKAMRREMNEFRERLAENEASIKSFHKRLDKIEVHLESHKGE